MRERPFHDTGMDTGTGCPAAFAVQYRQSEAIFIVPHLRVKALLDTT
jgi:hypothetical protein